MHRVLVIDDLSSVRTAIRLMLEHLDLHVEEAANGQEGIRCARQHLPDLMLCDLEMPVMDGFQTLELARNDPALAKVPIIVVSGILSADTKREVIAMGASAVLEKPFTLADLSSLVQRHLESSGAGPDPHALDTTGRLRP